MIIVLPIEKYFKGVVHSLCLDTVHHHMFWRRYGGLSASYYTDRRWVPDRVTELPVCTWQSKI